MAPKKLPPAKKVVAAANAAPKPDAPPPPTDPANAGEAKAPTPSDEPLSATQPNPDSETPNTSSPPPPTAEPASEADAKPSSKPASTTGSKPTSKEGSKPVASKPPSGSGTPAELKTLDGEIARAKAGTEQQKAPTPAQEELPASQPAPTPVEPTPVEPNPAEAPIETKPSAGERLEEAPPPTAIPENADPSNATQQPQESAEQPLEAPALAESRPAKEQPVERRPAQVPKKKAQPEPTASSQARGATPAEAPTEQAPPQSTIAKRKATPPNEMSASNLTSSPVSPGSHANGTPVSPSANYVAELGTVTHSTTSPLTHLMCHGPSTEDKRRKAISDVPQIQPPMKHGNPADTRGPSPTGGRHVPVAVDPQAQEKTLEEKKRAREMRKERRRREREKLQAELEEAERRAHEAMLQRDMDRQRRENELKERLEGLRQRKAERELEFLVSEKRAQQVRASKSLADIIQEQYDAKQQEEEEKRQRQLQERREKLHAPVVTGLEAVKRHFELVEERRRRKEDELRERELAIASSHASAPYQGASYGQAVEEYIKSKNTENDARHKRLYKHAKMQEYGNLVKRLYGPQPREGDEEDGAGTPHQPPHRCESTPPFVLASHQQAHGAMSPIVVKESLLPAERNKNGNQYLREALATRTPLPAGLKVQPLVQKTPKDQEFERLKDRKKKGDRYLRELRDVTRHAHTSPHATRGPQEAEEEQRKELRRLKARTATIENRLYDQPVDVNDPEACLQSNEEYLEVVRLKLEMLRRSNNNTTHHRT
jgi:hypothetical protein